MKLYNIALAVVVGTAIVTGISAKIFKHMETPCYSAYFPISRTVGFYDNCAVGMTATMTDSNGKKTKMIVKEREAEYATFHIPKEALEAEEFTVQATDRDDNKSKPVTLTNLEGVIVNAKDI